MQEDWKYLTKDAEIQVVKVDKDYGRSLQMILPNKKSMAKATCRPVVIQENNTYYLTFFTKTNTGVFAPNRPMSNEIVSSRAKSKKVDLDYFVEVSIRGAQSEELERLHFPIRGSMKNWKQYTFHFAAPRGAKTATITFAAKGNAWGERIFQINLDDVNLYREPKERQPKKLMGAKVFNRKTLKKSGKNLIHTYTLPETDLRLQTIFRLKEGRLCIELETTSLSSEDRGIEIGLGLDTDFRGGTWWHNNNRSEKISKGRYWNVVSADYTTFMPISIFPLSAITYRDLNMCFGTELEHPLVFRMFYDTQLQGYCYTASIGLSQETKKPNYAKLRFFLYLADSEWGMRGAMEKFYTFFPEYYTMTPRMRQLMKDHPPGQLMPAKGGITSEEDIKTLHITMARSSGLFPEEKAKKVYAKYQSMGIKPLLYTAPYGPGLLVGEQKGTMPTYDEIMAAKEVLPKNDILGKKAKRQSICRDTNGDDIICIIASPANPWAKGKWWPRIPINCDPELPSGGGRATLKYVRRVVEVAKKNNFPLGGIVMDFFLRPFYVLDCARDRFKYADFPLSYSANSFQAGVPAFSTGYEYMVALKDYLSKNYPQGLIACNFRSIGISSFAGIFLDGFGFEMKMDGGCSSEDDWQFRRFVAGFKPVTPLHLGARGISKVKNPETFIDAFVNYSLSVGFYPNLSDIIWKFPDDRKIRSMLEKSINSFHDTAAELSRSEWRPIPYARASMQGITIERFKKWEDSTMLFAIYNSNSHPAGGTISFFMMDLKKEIESKTTKTFQAVEVVTRDKSPREIKLTQSYSRVFALEPKGFTLVRMIFKENEEKK